MKKLWNLWAVVCLCSCAEVCHVQGHIEGLEGETELLVMSQIKGFNYDTVATVPLRDGDFDFELPRKYFGEAYELQFGDHPGRGLLFAEAGKVKVRGHKDSLFYSKAFGTRANDEWGEYQKFTLDMIQQREKEMFAPEYQSMSEEFKTLRKRSVMKKYEQQMQHYQDSLNGDGCSVAALYAYWKRYLAMDGSELENILMKFGSELTENRYFMDMANRKGVLKRTAPGSMAPVFMAKALSADSIALTDLRGKYVILDFWASWCMPCRAESVHVKKLYQQYRERGLDVFSVSLDKDEAAWKKAIEQDGMEWQHAILLGENKNDVSELYGIVGIPAIWVIDPDGKIIAKGLRGEKLEEFCRGLFE